MGCRRTARDGGRPLGAVLRQGAAAGAVRLGHFAVYQHVDRAGQRVGRHHGDGGREFRDARAQRHHGLLLHHARDTVGLRGDHARRPGHGQAAGRDSIRRGEGPRGIRVLPDERRRRPRHQDWQRSRRARGPERQLGDLAGGGRDRSTARRRVRHRRQPSARRHRVVLGHDRHVGPGVGHVRLEWRGANLTDDNQQLEGHGHDFRRDAGADTGHPRHHPAGGARGDDRQRSPRIQARPGSP